MQEICPICDSANTRRLLHLPQQPISSALHSSFEAARAVQTADVGLRYCINCDHRFNDLFDAQHDNYPRTHPFPDYQTELYAYLNGRFPLKSKQVVDIGAMDGVMLRELAANGSRGIGFLPQSAEETPDVTWIEQPFSESFLNLSADLILCRQTPQHVWNVRALLTLIHSFAFRWHAPVLLETQNALQDDLWDLRYERCHYFSPLSLWKAVKEVRFTPTLESQPVDGHLLSAVTMPLATPIYMPPKQIGDPRPLVQTGRLKVAEWTATLGQMRQQQDCIVVWGANARTIAFLNILPTQGVIGHAIDDESAGRFIPRTGQSVQSVAFLNEYNPDVVIVMDEKSQEDFGRILPTLTINPTIMLA